MKITLAIDFGSTYTKIVAVDLSSEELVGVAKSPTTVDTDITIGLRAALDELKSNLGVERLDTEHVLACSSAAGGLRIVVAGLVRELTTKAANEAALGAGAKIVGIYSNGLNAEDVEHMERIAPDLVVLAGGTDGGNKDVMIQNAKAVAASSLSVPMVIAGNRMAAREAKGLLDESGKYAVITENVLPELDRLNVEPTREIIRETFIRRIVQAKGLDKARAFVGDIIMPTPMAVLKGASLLAEGTEDEVGLGELIVVDVGGATTDIHSVAHGHPTENETIVRGLPEPYVKRTVEGDLGIRYNATSILEMAGEREIRKKILPLNKDVGQAIDVGAAATYLSANVGAVPQKEADFLVDIGLSSTAVDIATQRHAGMIEMGYFPSGKVRIQRGKDLRKIGCVVGTGGIFAYGKEPYYSLKAACYDDAQPESLRPVAPEFFVDERYILYAVGLLAERFPTKALRIMKKYLRRL